MTILSRLAFLVFLIFVWWLASLYVPRGLFASPMATAEAAVRLWSEGRLQGALGQSLVNYSVGVLLASVVGIGVGLLMGAFRPLGNMLDIFVYALAATPRVAFIPLIIVLLGLGFTAKIFIIFLGAVMPIVLNTYSGVQNVDDDLIEMARSVGASKARIFREVVLPSATPFLVVGLRLGATIGLINTVVAELYTAVNGLGGLLAIYGNTFRMAEYFVVVLLLSLIGVTVTEGLRLVENRLMRWRSPTRG